MNHIRQAHNCNEISKEISSLLDGELDRHTANKLTAEIENCETCQQFYNNQSAYKKNVFHKVVRKSCGSNLKETLRSTIRGL